MRVAILESRPALADRIRGALGRAGFVNHVFDDLSGLLKCLRTETFDLFVLDWTVEGLQVNQGIKALRGIDRRAPVLVLAHHYHEPHLVSALNQGADDFMVNPLRLLELVSRVQALLRRAYPAAHRGDLAFRKYEFIKDPVHNRHLVMVDGVQVELVAKEFDLALVLFRNTGRPMSRAHIQEAAWGEPAASASRALDVVVSRLRKKLVLNGTYGFTLAAVYGVGYALDER